MNGTRSKRVFWVACGWLTALSGFFLLGERMGRALPTDCASCCTCKLVAFWGQLNPTQISGAFQAGKPVARANNLAYGINNLGSTSPVGCGTVKATDNPDGTKVDLWIVTGPEDTCDKSTPGCLNGNLFEFVLPGSATLTGAPGGAFLKGRPQQICPSGP
jgi:hypothetical protein